VGSETFACDLSAETLARTTLGAARQGTVVNLERPLAAGARLGGHFVLGHVDGVGRLRRFARSGGGATMTFEFPRELERYLVWKGSIAVDGISLTIASLGEDEFAVAVIPHTMAVTNLRRLRADDPINLEVDVLGKYFERFFSLGLTGDRRNDVTESARPDQGMPQAARPVEGLIQAARPGGLTEAFLKEQGF